MLLFTLLVFVIGTLKSYPSVGDLAMSLALVPLWTHLMPCMCCDNPARFLGPLLLA